MSTVTITITEAEEGVEVQYNFDPPLTEAQENGEEEVPTSVYAAGVVAQVFNYLFTDDEDDSGNLEEIAESN